MLLQVFHRLSKILLLLFLIFSFIYFSTREKKKTPITVKKVEETLGGKWQEKKGSFRYFAEKDKKKYAFLTDEVSPEVKGYCDEIGVLIEVDKKGEILSASALRGCETPYYFSIVKDTGFFDKLKGKKLSEPPKIDVVTGATVSSSAILKDVWYSGYRFSRDVLKLNFENPLKEKIFAWKEGLVFISFTLAIITIFFRKKIILFFVFILNLLFIGIILKSPITISNFSEFIKGNLPGLNYVLILFSGALIFSFFYKNLYCKYICPFGCSIEILSFPVKIKKAPGKEAVLGLIIRNFIAVFILTAIIFLDDKRAGFVEPFSWVFSSVLFGWFSLIFAGLTIAFSIWIKRFWCYYLCPTGGVLNTVEYSGRLLRKFGKKLLVKIGLISLSLMLFISCSGEEPEKIDMAYYSEFIPYSEVEKALPLFEKNGYSIHLAVPTDEYLSSDLENFLKKADSAEINVYLWLTLPYEQGYYINEKTIDIAEDWLFKFGEWNESDNLGFDGFVFDLEAPYYQIIDLASGNSLPITEVIHSLLVNYDPERFEQSRQKMRELVLNLKSRFSLPVIAVTYPMVLDDLEVGYSTLQDLFEIPVEGIDWDEVGFMVYTSLMRGYGIPFNRGIVASYARSAYKFYGSRASIGLGIAGGAGLFVGEKFVSDPQYFKDEVSCSIKEGVKKFRIYSIRGVLDSPESMVEEWFNLENNERTVFCKEIPQEEAFRKLFQSLSQELRTPYAPSP